jgi:hypothetical protein
VEEILHLPSAVVVTIFGSVTGKEMVDSTSDFTFMDDAQTY